MPAVPTSSLLRCFPPVADERARVLVLGSMPGAASLAAGEYYAHPRNAFWPIMGELVGARPDLPYGERIAALQTSGIALWDVIGACERRGSLDADIAANSVVANDFAGFFAAHPGIERVFFNGGMAEASFRRHALPQLGGLELSYCRLPSTSPAHAAKSLAEKQTAWSVLVEHA